MIVCVVGLGEVGLKFAAMASNAGHQVVGIDKSAERRRQATPVGLTENGYKFVIPNLTILPEPIESDAFVICVDSPVDSTTHQTDLSNLKAAAASVGRSLRPGNLVIVRSTVPVGTTRSIISSHLRDSSGLNDPEFLLAFAPERTSTGLTLYESSEIPHLVGGRDPMSATRASDFLRASGMRSLVMESLEAAELGKLASNAARDTALALAAQICAVAERHNIDVEQLVSDVNLDYPRDHVKMPRPGVGGSCLTKDSYILAESLAPTPLEETLFGHVRRINDQAQTRTIDSLQRHISGRFDPTVPARVLVCGAAFKGDPPTRDTRNAVSLAVARELEIRGFSVAVFDPLITHETISNLGYEPAGLTAERAAWDAILLYSNHKHFADPSVVRVLLNSLRPNGFVYDPYHWCLPIIDSVPGGTLYRTLSTERTIGRSVDTA